MLWSQAAPPAPTAKDYAGEALVVVRSDAVYKMAADGTGIETETIAARIQSEAALREAGVLNIAYASNSQRVEFVYVRARHPDGAVAETPGSEAIEMAAPVTREAPFYSDLKQKQLPVRNLKVGDTLEWQVRLIRTKAEAPGQFWSAESFARGAVVLSQTFELRFPKDKYVKVWSPAFKPEEAVDGEERVFRWQYAELKPTVGPEADKEKEAAKKKVWTAEQELEAKEGKLPDIAWTTFKSWEEVGAWYRKLEADRIAPSDDVKAKVAEVTAGKTTEEDKVKAVYSYVATNVRYIGVAFGIGRYQPHEAAEVLQNQYGDCKDKHTLLAAMLSALGLHPDAVLVGVGIRFNPDVPSPAAFNHLITRVALAGKPVWLDTTSEVAPYRVLIFAVRDRNVLVVPETGDPLLGRTPADLPFPAFQRLEANGTLDDQGVSNSRMVLTLRGDDEVLIRAVARQLQPGQNDLLVQKISEGMGFGGTVSHSQISRPEITADPLEITYDYKREQVGDWAHLQTLPQVPPVSLPVPDPKDPPLQAMALGNPRVDTSNSAMKIPDGWRVELPEARHVKSIYATFDQTYRFDKGVLYSERRVEVLKQEVPVADWKTYEKFTDASELGKQERYVQLIRHKAGGPAESTVKPEALAPPKASSADAAKLIQEAVDAIRRHELDAAQASLDQAKELNPQQPHLWSNYGYIAGQRKDYALAETDFQKELSLHPSEYVFYDPLERAQISLKHREDAKDTLRKWAAADEHNITPVSRLASLLIADGNAAGAVDVLTARLNATPEGEPKNEPLQLLLGQAQLKAGEKEKARQTLVVLLGATEDVTMMNDAAYELANAGLEIALAEKSARAALAKLEDESRSWTLDEKPAILKQKSSLIEATWDTVGWILFREGKAAEAEDYVRAAWLNAQSEEIGEHLAQIAEARGDKNAALTTYQLALGTRPWNVPTAKPMHPDGEVELRLTAKADALRKEGAKGVVKDPHDALQNMRMVPLGAAAGLNGTGEYRLLLSADKVEKVEAVDGKSLPGGDERLLKLKLAGWVPKDSKAELEKVALLNCHSGVCEAVFEP